jgi:hypothetical protein
VTARRLLKRAVFGAVLRSSLAHFLILPHPKINRRTPMYASGSNTTIETAHPPLANPSDLALTIQVPMKAKSGRLLVEPLTQRYLEANMSLVRSFSSVHRHLFSFTSDPTRFFTLLQAFARSLSFQSSILLVCVSVQSLCTSLDCSLDSLLTNPFNTPHVSVSTCQ